MKKRLIKNLLLVALMVVLCVAVGMTVSAQERTIIDSGECGGRGDNVVWTLYDDGELVISGEGDIVHNKGMLGYTWLEYDFYIRSVIIGEGVTSIGDKAFGQCINLTSVTIPDSMISIGGRAFAECTSLTSITIPESVSSIGYGAFSACTSLTGITVDENNKYYLNDSDGVLFNKDKTELLAYPIGKTKTTYTIPDSVISVGDFVFIYCENLTSIIIPDSVTSVGYAGFAGCTSLTSVTISDNITSIGDAVFAGCTSLTSITIPDSVISIGESAFEECTSLTNITIPDSVISIGDSAFEECTSFTNITIPDSVISIGESAFDECTSLTNITIPDSVTSVGNCAFYNCTSLTDVYYVGSQSQWNKIEIDSNNECLLNANIHFGSCSANSDGKHSYTPEITTPATHFTEGVQTLTCACGDSYTEVIAKTKEHIYTASDTVAPTCEDKGYIVYVCECGSTKKDNYTDKAGHKYVDQKCEICGKNCSCNCHKSGFMGFIWKITLFFNKLFKSKKVCACGVSHY
jgi:hypothetical protein